MLFYVILAACILAAIGVIVGFVMGYIRLSCWGGTVAGTVLACFVVDRAGFIPEGDWHGMIMLGVALGVLLVLTLLFTLVRRFLSRRVAVSAKLSFYRQHDAAEDNEESIMLALDKGDKKAYRKHSSVRFRQKRGAWGVVDRIFGAITLTINIFAVVAIIATVAFLIIDVAQITVARDFLADFYASSFWQGQGSALAVDLIVVTLMCICVRVGYNGGILSALSFVLILGVLGGAGYLAYHIVFNAGAFTSAAQTVYDNFLANLLSGVQGSLDGVGLTGLTLGRIVITAGVFVVLLIPAIIICVFIPRIIDKLRTFETVSVIDGAFGAVVVTAVVFAVLLFLGAAVWQINDLGGMELFNSYMERTHIANALYGDNYIATLSFMKDLPLRSWLGLGPLPE